MNQPKVLQNRIDALMNVLSEDVLIITQGGTVIFSSCSDSVIPWGALDSINGKAINELFPEHLAAILQEMINQALSRNQVMVKELLLDPGEIGWMQEGGMAEPCWVEARFAPSTGDEPSVVCRIEDINQRKTGARESGKTQRDLLTGMYNRRALMPVLSQSIAQALRYDWTCSLMIIDVDSLRMINEEQGWDVGDQILKRLAEALNSLKRTADFLARVDEDGFAILLPETNQEQGLLAAERVRNMVADLSAPHSGTDVAFTVSIGVSTLSGEGDTADEMFDRAFNGLQLAKQRGGNSIFGES